MGDEVLRVKLTAEGVAEVVNALRSVEGQAVKTGAKVKGSFDGIGKAIGGAQNLLGAFGIALSVGSMISFIKTSMTLGDELAKLNEKMGGTVKASTGLALAFKMADVDVSSMGPTMGMFSKNIRDFEGGTGKAAKALAELGFHSGDFKGKDLTEAIVMVSQKLGPLEAGWYKNSLAMDIFSRRGLMMIPAMNTLAREGMAPFIASLDRAFSEHAIKSAELLNDEFKKMGFLTQGLGIKFVEGFAPAAMQAMGDAEKQMNTLAESAYRMGQSVGLFYKILAAPFITVGAWLAGEAAKATVILTTLASVIQTLFGPGSPLGKAHLISVQLVSGTRQIASIIVDEAKTMGDAWASIMKSPPALTFPTTTGTGGKGNAAPAGFDSALAKAQRDRNLQDESDTVKALEQLWDQAYARGQVSLEEYYRRKAALRLEDLNAQIAAINAEKTEPNKDGTPKTKAEVLALDAKIAHLRAAGALAENAANEDIGQRRLELDKQIATAEREAFARTEEGYQAEDGLLNDKVEKYRLMLRQRLSDHKGTSEQIAATDMAIETRVADYRQALQNKADVARKISAAEQQLAAFEAAKAGIESASQSGVMSKVEAEARMLNLMSQELEVLKAMAFEAAVAAALTNDPTLIGKAAKLQEQVVAMTNAIAGQDDVLTRVKVTFQDALYNGMVQFFSAGITGAQTLGEAFNAMALSVVSAIQQILAQMMAMAIMKAIFGPAWGLAGGGKVSSGTRATQGQVELRAARGGLLRLADGTLSGAVRGPGGPTSDMIPALLSNGEFVVRAAVVRQPGVESMLAHLNAGFSLPGLRGSQGPHRFADGGFVAASGGAMRGADLSGLLTFRLPPGVGMDIEAPENVRKVIKVIAENPHSVNQVLGR